MDKKISYNAYCSLTAILAVCLLSAAACAEYSNIYGGIDEKGTQAPVPDASVLVRCSTGTTITTISDSLGNYDVYMDYSDCPIGSEVTVSAEKNGKSGINHGVVKEGSIYLGVSLIDVTLAPEIASLAAAAAGIAPAIAYLAIRRRK